MNSGLTTALAIKERKRHARYLLQLAVRRGDIAKPTQCEDCGVEPLARHLHGHHADYSMPLEVEWLCRDCHYDLHRPTKRPEKRKAVLARLSPELYKQLAELAKRENRSMTGQLNVAVEEHLEREKAKS